MRLAPTEPFCSSKVPVVFRVPVLPSMVPPASVTVPTRPLYASQIERAAVDVHGRRRG